MELIEEVEKTRRGLYGGVLGYLDFAGNADFAIAIRTALMRNGTAYVQAGGGVVADSNGPVRVHRGGQQGQGGAERDRRRRNADRAVIRIAPAAALVLPRRALWVASRMAWVEVSVVRRPGPAQDHGADRGRRGRRRWCRWRLLLLAAARRGACRARLAAAVARRCSSPRRARCMALPGDRPVGDPRRRSARRASGRRARCRTWWARSGTTAARSITLVAAVRHARRCRAARAIGGQSRQPECGSLRASSQRRRRRRPPRRRSGRSGTPSMRVDDPDRSGQQGSVIDGGVVAATLR